MEPLRLDADGRKANALHLGILLRLQIVALRRKWLQAVSITFGEARAWQPLPETCAGVVEQMVLRVPERRCFHVRFGSLADALVNISLMSASGCKADITLTLFTDDLRPQGGPRFMVPPEANLLFRNLSRTPFVTRL